MSTKTKTPAKVSRAALAALRDEANLARLLAESHLGALLADRREAEAEAARLVAEGHDLSRVITYAELFPEGQRGGPARTGGTVRYRQAPAPEAITAAEEALAKAEAEYAAAREAFEQAPEDTPGPEACRQTGARYYAGEPFALGPHRYHPGEPVPNEHLDGLDGRKLAALVKAGHLREGAPFAGLEARP